MIIDEKQLCKLLKRVTKPGRYTGNEMNLIYKEDPLVRFCFVFPDKYEIGMSYTGLQILYDAVNNEEGLYFERAFAPDHDMEQLMRDEDIQIFSLETKRELKDFDVIGFTLQYEMSFTNILNILDLARIPLHAAERDDDYPLIIAGGPCAYNPEPLADFFDLFIIGDGEIVLPELLKLKKECPAKDKFLERAAKMQGIYIPSFYDVEYNNDGTVQSYVPNNKSAPNRVLRAIVHDLDALPYPKNPIVPLLDVVHDRAVVETFRGCTRGCRFCQAGMLYRPVRERSPKTIKDVATAQLDATGHDELSLLSLSTSDYSNFEEVAVDLMQACAQRNVALSLPSLRLDSFSFRVLDEIQGYRKSGLTFAPEAGTQRLRDIINKNITEENIYSSLGQAMDLGWNRIKLYFMMGLPGETYEDLDGISEIAGNVMKLSREKGMKGRFTVSVSVANFVPKPFTPFQWAAQDTRQQFVEKHNHLSHAMKKMKGVQFNYHDSPVSYLEAVLARGDRHVGALIEAAFKNGCKFDSWSESFNEAGWEAAFSETGLDGAFYASRQRSYDEVLPWDIIDAGISKEFLINEAEKAAQTQTTNDCREGCVGCGINRYIQCPMEGCKIK